MADPHAICFMRGQLHAEEHHGLVLICRSNDGEVLVTMTLAMAEELAFSIERQAEQGRLLAAQNGRSDISPPVAPHHSETDQNGSEARSDRAIAELSPDGHNPRESGSEASR